MMITLSLSTTVPEYDDNNLIATGRGVDLSDQMSSSYYPALKKSRKWYIKKVAVE